MFWTTFIFLWQRTPLYLKCYSVYLKRIYNKFVFISPFSALWYTLAHLLINKSTGSDSKWHCIPAGLTAGMLYQLPEQLLQKDGKYMTVLKSCCKTRKYRALQMLAPLLQLPLSCKIYSVPMTIRMYPCFETITSIPFMIVEMCDFVILDRQFCLLIQSHRLTLWVIK